MDAIKAGEELLESAAALLAEIETFAGYLESGATVSGQQSPSLAKKLPSLISDVKSEMRNVESKLNLLRNREENETDIILAPGDSTNLFFLQALWDTAKSCSDLIWMRAKVYAGAFKEPILAPGRRLMQSVAEPWASKHRRNARETMVDLIADGGQKWVRISTITNKRLIFDLAKISAYCGDSDSDEDELLADNLDPDDIEIPIIKIAKELAQAVRNYKIRTRSPVPQLILPRMEEGKTPEVDKILSIIRNLGITVLCSDDLPPVPSLSAEAMARMCPNPLSRVTNVLNIDTSILMGLVSDFSNTAVEVQDWFPSSRKGHVQAEEREHILPVHYYPVLQGHDLVCTPEAADTCRRIVNHIGTESEKKRLAVILGDDSSKSSVDIAADFQSMSIYEVPSSLRLPLRILKEGDHWLVSDIAKKVLGHAEDPLGAVLKLGWANRYTTVTSASVTVKTLEQKMEALFSDLSDDEWPLIWVIPTARPLLATPPPTDNSIKKKRWNHAHKHVLESQNCDCHD